MTEPHVYRGLHRRATGHSPYPFQERLATEDLLPDVLHVPTGSGKTHAVLLAWLYRRFHADETTRAVTPRRLVYALPIRVLVEQVWRVVGDALDRLHIAEDQVGRHLVLGGQADRDWVRRPERPAVLVGSIDMLLSRALNRGYAVGRTRWPIEFGLLNADCLWVLDETQLMDVGAVTAAQLQGLRGKLGTWRPCHTIWMSATVDTAALATVDRPDPGRVLGLSAADLASPLGERMRAVKTLERRDGDAAGVVRAEHLAGTQSLAVHNTVRAAVDTHGRLARRPPDGAPELLLVHSRFRPPERRELAGRLTSPIPPQGRVICATQVIEAGVDLSARLLVTELAPWSSIVQRLGRCNREGGAERGLVRWLDVKRPEPYLAEELAQARDVLTRLEGGDVSPQALSAIDPPRPPERPFQVLRRRDLLDLFDTAPDLSGSDLDVSRYIRDADELDCAVLWRSWDGDAPPADQSAPAADELCPVPVGELRKLVSSGRLAWTWDAIEERWRRLRPADVRPGMEVLLAAAGGGYTPETGWDPTSTRPVPPVPPGATEPERNWDDPLTQAGRWVDLAAHTRDVETRVRDLVAAALSGAPVEVADALALAARGHDAGKALPRFQAMLLDAEPDEAARERRRATAWAKSARFVRPRERTPRHELASALALLQSGWLADRLLAPWADLALFLVAAHHGRARVAIRPWPGEDGGRQVLGVHDREPMPAVCLDGMELPAMELALEALRMGDGEAGDSWTTRTLRLRDHPELGPFRIAHLEALLRLADWRASEEESGA